ncbi:hypothetical protein LCGC14_1646000 [marine sediment metagenome]|uniref:Uncharacterized protein n=1 Tax=marine sediment metagenome TaxID=412755 RepID=A0A0F9KY60_9ZZZZ
MLQEFAANNFTDDEGLPAGGNAISVGLSVEWQRGPLKEGPSSDPNGAFVETLIAVALQRIEWYQEVNDGKFACDENRWAIECLNEALRHLDRRTKDRQARGVEGTHQA